MLMLYYIPCFTGMNSDEELTEIANQHKVVFCKNECKIPASHKGEAGISLFHFLLGTGDRHSQGTPT